MHVELIQATPNPIETIAAIASICYDSNPKNPLKLVEHLYKNGHHSVMEHIYFTFKIEGISRACSHQLVRHRHCSFTQRSQRYCSEEGFEYVTPPAIDDSTMICNMDDVADWYRYYQDKGVSNERLCTKAQWEIRELVKQMVALVDPQLQFMLVPKCKSGRIICNSPCTGGKK